MAMVASLKRPGMSSHNPWPFSENIEEFRAKSPHRHLQNNKKAPPCNLSDITNILQRFTIAGRECDPLTWLQALMKSKSLSDKKSGVVRIRKLLAVENNHPTQQLIENGVVPFLIQMIKASTDPELLFEACWALTNISAGNSQQTLEVVKEGAVPILVALLSLGQSEYGHVREQAIWALGNIAGESADCRDFVLSNEILARLLPLIEITTSITFLRVASWAMSNLCGSTPQCATEITRKMVPSLVQLFDVSDDQILADACWAFFQISREVDPTIINNLIALGGVKKLVGLLDSRPSSVKHPALKTLGNICCGSHAQTQHVLDTGVLGKFKRLFKDPAKCVRRESCWMLSNITAGTTNQIEEVISSKLLAPLISLAVDDCSDIREEAAWALANTVTGGRDIHIVYLVEKEKNFVETLCFLITKVRDQTLSMVLTALECILNTGQRLGSLKRYQDRLYKSGALKTLTQLANHNCGDNTESSQKIFHKATRIVNRHFQGCL